MKRSRRSTKSSRKRSTRKKKDRTYLIVSLSVLSLFITGLLIGYLVGRRSVNISVGEKPKEIPLAKRKAEKRVPTAISGRKKGEKLSKVKAKGLVAIVIDDFGYRKVDIDRFKKLPYPISVSIIPFTLYEKYSAQEAIKFGKSVMLHIPMEPNSSGEKIEKLEKKTKGMLNTKMTEKQIRALLREEIKRVPYAVGANNHMGSKFTRFKRGMRVVLDELNRNGLFFLDSRTVAYSLGVRVGREMGIVVLKRDIFLDNSQDVNYIKHQLDELAKIAVRRGYAIAIGHPHITTYLALKEKLPELEKKGIEVVPIEKIYEMCGGNYAGGIQKTGNLEKGKVSFLSRVPSWHSSQAGCRSYR